LLKWFTSPNELEEKKYLKLLNLIELNDRYEIVAKYILLLKEKPLLKDIAFYQIKGFEIIENRIYLPIAPFSEIWFYEIENK